MSGSKLLRLCSLCLCLLLLVVNFSVVANAAEAEENLVDTNLQNWDKLSEHDMWGVENSKIYPLNFNYSSFYEAYSSNVDTSVTGSFAKDMYGGICELTDLVVGQRYKFSIDLKCSISSFTDYFDIFVGVCYFKNGTFYPYDNVDMLKCSINSNSYTTNIFEFEYSYNGYQPYLYIVQQCIKTFDGSGYRLLLKNVSLTREITATEKKLDGILGWLEDIKNSIVGLPETIKTNFQTFFTDLQSKIIDMKDGVVTKLSAISSDFSGYITGLGDRVSGFFTDLKENISAYFTDLWNKFSAFFEKFKPRINVDFGFKNGYFDSNNKIFHYDNNSSCMISDVICVPSGCELHLSYKYLSGGRFRFIPCDKEGNVSSSASITTYFQDYEVLLSSFQYFRVECYSFEVKRVNGYVDVGWFTYFINTLKHKIDLKVIEIKTSIHDFFVPPEGFFEEWKVTFDLMLSDNLGFIYQAPNFVIDIVEVVQEILQSDQEVNLVFPAVEFDIAGYHIELFKDTKVDFSFLEAGIWLTLYSMYKVMLYVIFALALIKYGMSTWERTMAN